MRRDTTNQLLNKLKINFSVALINRLWVGRDDAALMDPALTQKTAQNAQITTRWILAFARCNLGLINRPRFANLLFEIYLSLLSSVFDISTRISIIIVPVATSKYSQMPHNKYKE